MGKWMMFLLAAGLVLSSNAGAADRYSELAELYAQYNQRFDSQGKYRPNDRLAEEFTRAQEAFAGRMKATGALQEVLHVENSFDQSLWVRLYILQDESGHLMTFYWEQGKYQDEEVRSYLRFRSLASVEQGLKFVPVLSTHAFVVKGVGLTPNQGGPLQIIYAANIRENTMVTQTLQLGKGGNRWSLWIPEKQQVTRAWIDVWTQWIPPNGGVRGLRLY